MSGLALAQATFTKVQVADRIRKVEDGVDEFRKWSEKRVEQAEDKGPSRPARARGGKATESQKKDSARGKER